MAHSAVLHLLCVFGLFQKGLTDLIRTQRTVTAAVGEEAGFRCELLQSKDVVQVIWYKVLPDRDRNLISYHKKYGQDVNPAFKDKVGFTDAGLQNSSIFIRNVTEEDEGCYLCLFNADPEGALIGKTCLQLYGFNEDSVSEITRFTIITTLSVVLVFCCVAAAVITVLLIRRHMNRDPEEVTTPQKPNKNTENKTPLMQEENELIRLQTSTGKNE